eukprot:1157978-Pelagomonas_calceolata.AAC.3
MLAPREHHATQAVPTPSTTGQLCRSKFSFASCLHHTMHANTVALKQGHSIHKGAALQKQTRYHTMHASHHVTSAPKLRTALSSKAYFVVKQGADITFKNLYNTTC